MAAFAGVVATTTTTASITFLAPAPAHAYERRDVGGDDRSAEQAAYNLQAFETNSRLEREGFKLDTQEEQKASLMAELSQYSYDTPAKDAKKQKNKAGKAAENK